MQTFALIDSYLQVKAITEIVIQYLKAPVDKSTPIRRYYEQNGLFEDFLTAELDEGLYGAINGGHEHIVELMIRRGATLNQTRVEYACRKGNLNVIRTLHFWATQLSCKIDWNSAADVAGNMETLEFLCDHDANDCDRMFKGILIAKFRYMMTPEEHKGVFISNRPYLNNYYGALKMLMPRISLVELQWFVASSIYKKHSVLQKMADIELASRQK